MRYETANLKLRLQGREVYLRRAVLTSSGPTRYDGPWAVESTSGRLLAKACRQLSVAWAQPVGEKIIAAKWRRERGRQLRELRRLVEVRGERPTTTDWALAELLRVARAGQIAAVDFAPKSEAAYYAPAGADLSEANRGPRGAYRGWVRMANHAGHRHQECEQRLDWARA